MSKRKKNKVKLGVSSEMAVKYQLRCIYFTTCAFYKSLSVVGFQAVLCDLAEVTQGSVFYLTAGASYDDDAYVWVGQIPLTTNLAGKVSQSYRSLEVDLKVFFLGF